MNLRELKILADKNNVHYHKNYNEKKMLEVLEKANIFVNDTYEAKDHKVNESSGAYLQGVKDVALDFKHASTALEKKRAEQKMAALRIKINESKDKKSLISFLRWQRSRKLITVQDNYLLNKVEMDDIPEERKALCIRRLPVSSIHAKVSESYKYSVEFKPDYVNKATKEVGNTFYTFYVPRVISGDKQVGRELATKIARGFMPNENDYVDDKTLIDKHVLIESEFVKYFKVEDEGELEF